jgi:hypothetical protein
MATMVPTKMNRKIEVETIISASVNPVSPRRGSSFEMCGHDFIGRARA